MPETSQPHHRGSNGSSDDSRSSILPSESRCNNWRRARSWTSAGAALSIAAVRVFPVRSRVNATVGQESRARQRPGPLLLRLPMPAHEPAALAKTIAEPQGSTFVHRIGDPEDGRADTPWLLATPAEAEDHEDPLPSPQRFRKSTILVGQHDADPCPMVLELVGRQIRFVFPSDTIVKLSLGDPKNRAGKCPKIDPLVESNGCNGYS